VSILACLLNIQEPRSAKKAAHSLSTSRYYSALRYACAVMAKNAARAAGAPAAGTYAPSVGRLRANSAIVFSLYYSGLLYSALDPLYRRLWTSFGLWTKGVTAHIALLPHFYAIAAVIIRTYVDMLDCASRGCAAGCGMPRARHHARAERVLKIRAAFFMNHCSVDGGDQDGESAVLSLQRFRKILLAQNGEDVNRRRAGRDNSEERQANAGAPMNVGVCACPVRDRRGASARLRKTAGCGSLTADIRRQAMALGAVARVYDILLSSVVDALRRGMARRGMARRR